jgi:hypothetical protein
VVKTVAFALEVVAYYLGGKMRTEMSLLTFPRMCSSEPLLAYGLQRPTQSWVQNP